MTTALLLIDFINEIVHEQGKLAGKGYGAYMVEYGVFAQLARAIGYAREQQMPVIHVRVGFSAGYGELPKGSPLFGKAEEAQALLLDTWATEFHDLVEVGPADICVTKHRVNAFHGTNLDTLLKEQGIDTLLVAGVATDLAVSSTVRDAHDRDYAVTILEDCCAAANRTDHDTALLSLAKIAQVKLVGEVCGK